MLTIGLTGGIGSGKSTVANLFEALGAPVVDADKISREITQPNGIAFDAIVNHFGKKIITADGTLNRNKLREIVFNNLKEKKWLEQTLHPIILEIMKKCIEKIDAPYCLLVIPLLLESKNIDFVDRVLVVDAPESLQIQRTQQRSQLDEKTIRAIMQSQSRRQERLAMADDVIVNDASIEALSDKVNQLHAQYLMLS